MSAGPSALVLAMCLNMYALFHVSLCAIPRVPYSLLTSQTTQETIGFRCCTLRPQPQSLQTCTEEPRTNNGLKSPNSKQGSAKHGMFQKQHQAHHFHNKSKQKVLWAGEKNFRLNKKKNQNVNCLPEHEMTCKYKKIWHEGWGHSSVSGMLVWHSQGPGFKLNIQGVETEESGVEGHLRATE